MHKFLSLSLATALLVGFAQNASASDACYEKAQSTADINECASQDVEAANKELSSVYNRILQNIEKDLKSSDHYSREHATETKVRLVTAQRAWEAFREANTQLHGIEMLGGSGEAAVQMGTTSRMTKERTKELRELFQVK